MGKIEHLLGTNTPARKFRYTKDTKVLTIWWEMKDKATGRRKLCPYLYLGVPNRVVERLRQINVPVPIGKLHEAMKGRAPSVGTYINTKIKKYPAINLSKTGSDAIQEAVRVSEEVRTRSTKPGKKNKVVGDFLRETAFPGQRN